MDPLYPSIEPAMAVARSYLAAKEPSEALLVEFQAAMGALRVHPDEVGRICKEWAAGMHNSGRMSGARAAHEADERKKYALGHFARSRAAIESWLQGEPDRVARLRAVLKEA